MSVLSFNHLPLEILLGYVAFLACFGPSSLSTSTLQVSTYLNGVSRCRDVWSNAYRKAHFVRPPGPFLSQTAHDLEHALVSSFRVHQNLRHGGSTAQSEMPTLRKLREIRYTGVDLSEVRCYDLNLDAFDSNSGASIIYRTTDGTLKAFHCVSAIDVEGRPFACVVLSEAAYAAKRTQISIYSLNVAESSEVTLDLLYQFEHREFNIRSVDLGPRVIVVQGRAPQDGWRVVALDVHTQTEFLLPSFTDGTQEADEAPQWTAMTPLTSISTSTHLLLARSLYTVAAGWSTFFQAFSLPRQNTYHRFTPLNHSHCGIIPSINVRDVVLLHDAVLDSCTQDTLITIRVHAFEPSRPHAALSKYGTLRLGRSRDGVGTITFQSLGSLGQLSRTPFFHPSFNGTGRVFYTPEPGSYGIIAALEYDVRSDDPSDESGAKVTEYPTVIRFQTLRTLSDYDPYSGRICLQSTMAKYRVIEILDLAV